MFFIFEGVLGVCPASLGTKGEAQETCWWGAQFQFADKQTLFEPNLPTNRTFLEFLWLRPCQEPHVN